MQELHINHKIKYTAVFVSLLWLIQPTVNAQSDDEILESVRSCQRVAGLSSRLSCYDLVLPPLVVETADTVNSLEAGVEPVTVVMAPQPSLENVAQIIEVQSANIRSFRLVAADGRVFSQTNAASRIQWPETPFEVEIQTGFLGTKYIKIPERDDRIRVKVED